MAFTLNRRLAQLVDSNGQLNTGKIPNDYITSDHVADNTITAAMLHTSFTVAASNLTSIDTDDVSEGSTNLYYTDARVGTYISGNRDYGNITTTGYIAGPATFTIDPAAVGDNTGTVVIAGNLQVDGTTTTINSTTMTVDDLNITLASGAANAAAANGAGITVDGASATITYNNSSDRWVFNKSLDVAGNLFLGTAGSNNGVLSLRTYDDAANRWDVYTWTDDSFRLNYNGSGADEFVILNDGKVGIGTVLPGEKLHVSGNARIEPSSGENFIISRDTAGPYFGTASNHSLRLITNNGSRVNFDTDGRVLIGVTNGSVLDGYYNPRLQIEEAGSNDSATRGMAITYGRNNGGGGAVLNFNRHAGTSTTSKGNILDNYAIGEIVFRGYHTNNFDVGAAILARVKGTPADGVVPTELIFSTTNSSGSHINALVIDPNQRVGIGTEDPGTSLEIRKDTASGSYGQYPAITIRNDNATGYGAIHFDEGSTQRARIEVGNNSGSPYILMNTGTASGQGVYVDGDGRVGIGTITASSYTYGDLVIDGLTDSGNATGITLVGTSYNGIFMADGTSGDERYRGFVQYNHNHTGEDDALLFGTGGTEKMRISENGTLGINKTGGFGSGGFGDPGIVIKQKADSNWGGVNIEANGNDSIFALGTTDTEHVIAGSYRASAGYKDLDFVLGGSSNRMHIQASNGYIGINRNDPSYYLDIKGGSDNQLRLDSQGASHNTGIFFAENGSNKWELYHRGASNDFRIYSFAKSDFVMKIAGTTGHVSIGGTSTIGSNNAQKQLEVWNDTDNDFVSVGVRQHSTSTFQGIHFGYAEPQNSDYRKSAIVFERTDLTSNNAQGKVHILNGPQSGSASATLLDAKLTIAENGYVGLGDTSPAHKLEIDSPDNYKGVHIRGTNAPCYTMARGTGSTAEWRMGLSGYDYNDFAISAGAGTGDKFRMDPDGNSWQGSVNNKTPRINLHSTGQSTSFNGPISSGYAVGPGGNASAPITRDWFTYSGGTSIGSNRYVHMKTNLYGGSGNNSEFTMSCFTYHSFYHYGSNYYGHGVIGWHNWSGSFYNVMKHNYGNFNLVQDSYISSDGYVVLVADIISGYAQFTIDWAQWGGYGFRDKGVTNVTNTSSTTGAY